MKITSHFEMLDGGEEKIVEIIGAFVYEGNIYLNVDIDGMWTLYQILPRGMKKAPKSLSEKFEAFVREKERRNGTNNRCDSNSK